MTIELPPELETVLKDRAESQGTTAEALAIEGLRDRFLPEMPAVDVKPGETMADFLAEFIGCIHSGDVVPGGANLSEDTGKKFTEILLEKRRQGKL